MRIHQIFEYTGKNVNQRMSYDNWLKRVKKIEKGAHGITGPQHTKYSKEWKAYRGESVKEAHTDTSNQQKDPRSPGSRGLKFITKKIEATKRINNPVLKNKVDKN